LVLDPHGPLPLHLHLPPGAILTAPKEIPVGQPGQIMPYEEKTVPDPGGPIPQPPMHEWMRKARDSMPSLDNAMAEHICCALQLCNGKIYGPGGAGELLRINPNTLRKRMDKLGIPYGRIRFRRRVGGTVD
jgi:hypothetical protein